MKKLRELKHGDKFIFLKDVTEFDLEQVPVYLCSLNPKGKVMTLFDCHSFTSNGPYFLGENDKSEKEFLDSEVKVLAL